MGDKNQISMESKITFTLKGFLATIMTILSIFASFYFMVIDPRIQRAEVNAEKLLEAKTESINIQLKDIRLLIEADHQNFKNGIKTALEASSANTHRFKDIDEASKISVNSGGSSSSSTESEGD